MTAIWDSKGSEYNLTLFPNKIIKFTLPPEITKKLDKQLFSDIEQQKTQNSDPWDRKQTSLSLQLPQLMPRDNFQTAVQGKRAQTQHPGGLPKMRRQNWEAKAVGLSGQSTRDEKAAQKRAPVF